MWSRFQFKLVAVAMLAALGLLAATIGVTLAYNGDKSDDNDRQQPGDAEQVAKDVLPVAKADMAQRLGIGVEDVEIVKIEDATWNDTSLGAPRDGEMYAQVVSPGFVITLTAEGYTYVYHTDTVGSVALVVIAQ